MPRAPRPAEPRELTSVLFRCGQLPERDQLYIAAEYRFDQIRATCGDDTRRMAIALGVSMRQVQRLRVAFGVARPAGG
jgi:hypothetical protein